MKTIKLFEEFKKNNIEINLGLELENVSREGKKLTFQEFMDLFGIKSGDVDGKEMGKALMDQMKYRKLTDEEFNKLYSEYKGEELTKESLDIVKNIFDEPLVIILLTSWFLQGKFKLENVVDNITELMDDFIEYCNMYGYAIDKNILKYNFKTLFNKVKNTLNNEELTKESLLDKIEGPNFQEVLDNFKNLTPNELFVKFIWEGSVEGIEYALEKGADVNYHNQLRFAVQKENMDVIKCLVENGINIHESNEYPLRYAVELGNLEIVKYLVDHGANIRVNYDEPLKTAKINRDNNMLDYINNVIKKSNINESLLGSIQLIALGYFIWKFIMSLIENKFRRDNQRLQDKLIRLNIKQILSYIKNINKIQVIDLQDRYFLKLPSVDGNSVDIRVMKEERILSIDTIKGSFKLELTDDEYNEFISLLSKK